MDNLHILVTGGCGFIGSNFIRSMLSSRGCTITNLDKLTYAGNLENLKDLEGASRIHVRQGRHRERGGRGARIRDADRRGGQFCRGIPRGQEHHGPGRVREDQHLRHLSPPGAGAPQGRRRSSFRCRPTRSTAAWARRGNSAKRRPLRPTAPTPRQRPRPTCSPWRTTGPSACRW